MMMKIIRYKLMCLLHSNVSFENIQLYHISKIININKKETGFWGNSFTDYTAIIMTNS